MSMFERIIDPATGQTESEISEYLRASEAGTAVAIRDTQYGILRYTVAEIIETKSGRVRTDTPGHQGGTSWYMTTGKSSTHPKGQSRLFKPSDAIRSYIEANPTGILTYDVYRPGP